MWWKWGVYVQNKRRLIKAPCIRAYHYFTDCFLPSLYLVVFVICHIHDKMITSLPWRSFSINISKLWICTHLLQGIAVRLKFDRAHSHLDSTWAENLIPRTFGPQQMSRDRPEIMNLRYRVCAWSVSVESNKNFKAWFDALSFRIEFKRNQDCYGNRFRNYPALKW